MNTPTPLSGTLRTRLEIPSWRLSQNLPIEVRDSQLRLVGELRNNDTIALKPGWYEVSAVLNDGRRHSETVCVMAGDLQDVALGVDADALMPTSTTTIRTPKPRKDVPKDAHKVEFLSADEATLERSEPERWIFLPKSSDPKSMPLARIKIGDDTLEISLPVNPLGHDEPDASCVMTFERQDGSLRVRAGFHPDRIVSAAIHSMVEKRQFAQATAAAEATAEDMLQSKYRDPVGAALGALIMYRAGTLAGRRAWLNNLQRDFDWLPDGKILFAVLSKRSDPELTADLLLRASAQRPLFTESFSILFGALREWSSPHHSQEMSEALRQVTRQARRIDWSAFTLTDRRQ